VAGNPYLDLPPLGETPAPAKDTNPYLALDKLNDEGAQLRATLSEASRSDPAQARQADVLAKKQSLPQDTVLRNLRDVSMQNAVDEADRRLKTAPDLLEKFRTQPFFAKQAQDDLDALIAAHGELKAWKGPEPGVGSVVKGFALALPQGLGGIREGLRTQVTDLMEAAGILAPDPIRAANDARRLQQAQDAAAHTEPAFESATARAIYGGVVSTIQQAPGILAGILTGTVAPGLVLIGMQQQAQSYGKYRLRGGSPLEATVGSALEAAIEVGTEMIPMKYIVNRFGKAGFGEFVSGLFGREVLTEQLATAGEDFVDYAIANPEKTFKQYLEDRPGAAYQTLISTITQSLLMGGAGAVANRLASDTQKQQWADEEQKKLATLFSIAATSKLKTDNPVSFAQTIQEIADKTDGAPKSVFVDARALVEMQQAAGLSDEVFFQMLPSARDKIAEASIDNGVVELPIGEVTATVPGSKIEQAFMQQVRMDPTAPNELERTEASDKAEGYLKSESDKVIAEAENAQAVIDSADVVRQEVVKQLEATKRFKPEVSQRYADLHAAFFTVLASKLGITPEQAFKKYGASVRSTLSPGQVYRDGPRRKPGEVTVEGFNYGKNAERTTLSGANFGNGLAGNLRDQFLNAKDKRLSKRIYFYADKGTGINPEAGVGSFARKAQLDNVYDANSDPLRLRKGDQQAFESAVLDAGFRGYLDRLEGTQSAQVILLGDQNVNVERLGPMGKTKGAVVPAPAARESLGRDIIIDALAANKTLPSGSPTIARWQEILPDDIKQALAEAGVFDGDQQRTAYKSELAAAYAAATEAPVYGQAAQRTSVPARVASVAGLSNARTIASSKKWANNRDFKMALQKAVRVVLRGGSLRGDNPAVRAYLVRQILSEAREALITNPNAIGWYDGKVTTALEIVSVIHPELKTDEQAKFAFIWALAVTSNGVEVGKNFEIAERAYNSWKQSNADPAKRRMPTSGIGVGPTAGKIHNALATYNDLMGRWGYDRFRAFATTLQPNRQVKATFGRGVSGEGADTQVYGAGVVGPKIGNGFFMNLYGEFGQLTMDRWWVRMWGRLTGDLIERDLSKINSSRDAMLGLSEIIKQDPEARAAVERTIKAKLNKTNPKALAKAIIRASMTEANRDALAAVLPSTPEIEAAAGAVRGKLTDFVSVGDELRKAAKAYANAMDGQIEVPGGSRRRDMMRAVSRDVLAELQKDHPALTMADFQALMWYPEKTLYETAGAKDDATDGYDDEEAPDYANAAAALAKQQGVTDEQINAAIERARVSVEARQLSGRSGRATGSVQAQGGDGAGTTADTLQQRASEGPVLLNVGLAIPAGGELTPAEAKAAIEAFGVKVTDSAVHQSNTEQTLVAQLDRALTPEEADALSRALGQEAVVQMVGNEGALYGPEKEKWGDFNPDYFLTLKGDKASAVLGQSAPQTETPEFKKWFGGSKVVDADGKPLVVYHGTMGLTTEVYGDGGYEPKTGVDDGGINAFDRSKTGLIHFTPDLGYAHVYARDSWTDKPGDGAHLYPVYLAVTNPVYVHARDPRASDLTGGYDGAITYHTKAELEAAVAAGEMTQAEMDRRPVDAEGRYLADIGVRNSEQIKSAIGNQGTFDPNDPNILKQNKPDPLGTFNPSTLEISLLADANLSTFLHETGHFFLEVLGRVAAEPNAPKEIVDDMNALLKELGVKDLETWNAMTFAEREPHHEKMAESFEKYLFEGKAPSLALRQSFQRFKEFLISAYETLKKFIADHPEAKLNDEIRAVFDRLLATGQQIEEAETQARFEEIFKSAKDAGMTEDEWKAYQAKHQDATQDALEKMGKMSLADTKWFVAARSKALREAQAAVADKRAEMKAQVTAEVMALPVEQARAEIANLRASTPEQKAALKTWNEARAAALAQAKEELTAALVAANPDAKGLDKGQLLAKNKRAIANQAEAKALEWEQSHPRPKSMPAPLEMEVLAERLGYTSADHLRKDMLESPSAKDLIEAMTDQRLLETYGNLVTREGIEQAANEAVYNEARGRFVATELGAMQDAMSKTGPSGKTNRAGKPINVNVITQAARTFAETVVNRRRIMDLKPAQHTAAASRAAGKAAKLQAEGKTAEAIAAKRDQLLSHFTALYAFRAERDVASQLAYLKKFDKEGVRKSIPQSYLDQIDALLEKIDLRKGTSAKDIERRQSLAEWVEQQHEEGKSPILPPAVLADSKLTSYKEMTVEDFAGLVDSVQNIEHLGRLKGKLLKSADKRAWEAIRDEIVGSIRKFGGKAKPDALEPRGKAAQVAAGFWADHQKLNSLAYRMDGGVTNGPLFRAFVRGMNDSGAYKASEIAKSTQALAAIYAPIWALPGGTAGDLKFVPEINNSLTRGGRLAVALNWGNPQNRQRLMQTGVGAPWSQAQVEAILRTLTPVELKFVNDTWEFLDSFWPAVKAKQQRVSGVVAEKVEAVPFDVVAADGTMVHMRGGYYPIVYDNDRSNAAAKRDAVQIAKEMLRGAIGAAMTRLGHTKARVENVNEPLRLSLSIITQHVEQVVHDLAWHEWLIDANKILADKQIAAAIREHYGPEILKTMKANVDGIATGDLSNQTAIDQILLGLRSNVSRAVMGFSMTTGLLQPFGVLQSISRVGLAPVLKGAGRWAGDAARMESTVSWVNEKSDFMRLRAQTMNREINDISQRVKGKSKAAQVYDHSIFFLTQKMQLVADIPTWVGMYERAQAEGYDEATSVALADEAVKASQGGGQTQDLANIQRSKVGSLFTMFYGYFSTTVNIITEKTALTDFKNPLAVAGWLADMALLVTLPAILPNILIYAMRGGDDDDPESWAKRLAKWQAAYMLGLFVGARELSGITEGYDYAGPPVLRIFVDTYKAAKQLAQGDLDEAAVTSLARVMGDLFGIPSTQLIRSYRGWQAWADGDAPITAVLMGPPPRE
jgi:hypothetical protein